MLILLVLWAIGDLFAASSGLEDDDLRWHYLAIGSMILALGGLIGAPLGHHPRLDRRASDPHHRTGPRHRPPHQGHRTARRRKDTSNAPSPATDGTTFIDESTAPNIEVRLGAICALERIAQDSARDHIPVMETLCAYVRENATAHEPTDDKPTDRPRADIRAVLDVLSRREAGPDREGEEREIHP